MPQAIDRLLATPRIRPRLPRMRPEASDMMLLAAPPIVGLLWHRGQGSTTSVHREGHGRREPTGECYAGEWGNIVAAKVFIQVIWFTPAGSNERTINNCGL